MEVPMNQQDSEDKADPLDPHRRELQPPIPTHPPDPCAAGEPYKVVPPPDTPEYDPNDPRFVNAGLGSGPPIDQVGGPGLGKPPGDCSEEKPATKRDRDTRAVDQQDRTGDT
jgi:hypothetical protein